MQPSSRQPRFPSAADADNPLKQHSPADHLRRIQRNSRFMAWACLVLIVLLPVALVCFWAVGSTPALAAQNNLQASDIQGALMLWQRLAGAVVTAVPLGLLLVGVWQAKRCFDLFGQGRVFTAQAVDRLRRFAGWVAAAALAAIVAGAAISGLLTLNNPPGLRQLSVGISSNHVFTLFVAGLVWLMADVIGQGQALADENERFV